MNDLTIVIPAFNAELFIGNALNSIYKQEQDESIFSVIVVNDGSTDQTLKIVEKYQSLHSNIKIINQKNSGVSSARNAALKSINSRYVTFLDADDYFANKSLEGIFTLLNEFHSEILVLKSINDTYKSERYAWNKKMHEKAVYSFIDLFKLNYNRGSVCGVLYSVPFLKKNNILFPVGVTNAEDSIFFSLCMASVKCMTFHNIDFYRITTRDDSAMTTYNFEKITRFRKGVDYINDLFQLKTFSEEQKALFSLLKYRIISRCIHDACHINNVKLADILKIRWIKGYLPIDDTNITSNKKGIWLINRSYNCYCCIAFILNKLRKYAKDYY